MAADKIFHVLTEFQFEAAGALAESSALQKAVGGISSAAQSALNSLNSLGSALGSSLGINLGLVGALTAAVSSSENFTKNALSFSNIISANLDVMNGDVTTFNDRLLVSGKILRDIAKDAATFSLDEGNLLATTKQLAAVLAPKGLTGENFSNARNLARNFEKSAPTLGVDTFEAQGQLVRAIEGSASLGDTLFRRLLSETKAFGDLKKNSAVTGVSGAKGANVGAASKAFNLLPLEKRFGLIQEAMQQFANDADVLAGNANLLSNQLIRIKNLFLGVNSVLKPMGDVLVPVLKKALQGFATFIDTKGRAIAISLARFLEPIVSDPEKLYVTLRQLAALKTDLIEAGRLASLIGFAGLIQGVGKFLIQIPVVGAAFSKVTTWVTGLAAGMRALVAGASGFGGFFTLISTVFSAGIRIFAFLGRISFILGFFVTLFQIISRAKAIADVADLKAVIDNSAILVAKVTEAGSLLFQLATPFFIIIDDLARLIAPLFQISTYAPLAIGGLDLLGGALRKLVVAVQDGFAVIYGFSAGLVTFFFDVKYTLSRVLDLFKAVFLDIFERLQTLNFSGATSQTGNINSIGADVASRVADIGSIFSTAYAEGFDAYIKRVLNPPKDFNVTDKNVSQNITQIGKIEIRQDFKENMEPDRIAASFSRTLSEIANNPTQSRGNSLAGGRYVGR